MPPALKTENLHIGYHSGKTIKTVAGPLTAELQAGELVCIMGANGIGKSTFIKTIAGLQEPLSGSVTVSGRNIHQLTNPERAKLLAVVLTGRPATHFMRVRDLVELGRYPHTNWKNALAEEDKQAVARAIEAVGLTADVDTPVTELSDGNAQKAMIARALAQDTPLILLDEPTVHLDLRNKKMILELLVKLAKSLQKSILLASHDLHMMTQIADKLWLFGPTQIISGIPEDLMLNGIIEEILGTEEINLAPAANDLPTLSVRGDATSNRWLKQALQRQGYSLGAEAKITIETHNNGFKLITGETEQNFTSIEATLNGLHSLQAKRL